MTVLEMRKMAQDGNKLIETAILELLKTSPKGMTNAEIVNTLDLKSSHEGKHPNYLSYSILGNLMKNDLVIKFKLPSDQYPRYKLNNI